MAPDGQFMEAAFNFYSDRFKIESQLSAVLMRWYEGGIRAPFASDRVFKHCGFTATRVRKISDVAVERRYKIPYATA